MRKHTRRRVIVPMPPRGLRPKLAPDQVRDLGLAHWVNVDAIAGGSADESTLWQWLGGSLTWLQVASALHRRQPDRYADALAAMARQALIGDSVIDRWKRTGRVGFSGAEYQTAKDAAQWMDALAEDTDHITAIQAAEWSEARIAQLLATNQPAAAC
jgi:hypothetical protein